MRKIFYLAILFLLVSQMPVFAQSDKKKEGEIISLGDGGIQVGGKSLQTNVSPEDLEKMIAKVNKAIKKKPDEVGNYSTKAILLVNQKKIDEAIATIDKGIALDPTEATLIGQKGFFYYLKDDTINANQCFREAISLLEMNLNDPSVENYEKIGKRIDKYYFIYLIDRDKENYKNSLRTEFAKIYEGSDEINITDSIGKIDSHEERLLETFFSKEFIEEYIDQTVNSRDISKEGIWRLFETSAALLMKLQ